jgi:hypothetical protein
MSDLGKQLGRALGLEAALADAVIETAVDYVKTQRPDLAPGVDRLLASKRGASRVVAWIARWGRRFDPR